MKPVVVHTVLLCYDLTPKQTEEAAKLEWLWDRESEVISARIDLKPKAWRLFCQYNQDPQLEPLIHYLRGALPDHFQSNLYCGVREMIPVSIARPLFPEIVVKDVFYFNRSLEKELQKFMELHWCIQFLMTKPKEKTYINVGDQWTEWGKSFPEQLKIKCTNARSMYKNGNMETRDYLVLPMTDHEFNQLEKRIFLTQ